MDLLLDKLNSVGTDSLKSLERFKAEVAFARNFATAYPEYQSDWDKLIMAATDLVKDKFNAEGASVIDKAVELAEAMLEPIGKAAKEHTIHCVGHAHIDMNWTWSEFETVAVCHDTFVTILKLMDEYPDFKFAQSQVSIYSYMDRYYPELAKPIKERIKEGRWEVTSGCWTEIDDNMISGESFARNILYSKRYMKEFYDLDYDKLTMDWKADSFGHAWTLPTIMKHGGISRFYHMRPGAQHWLAWWQAPDGSRVLEFDDGKGIYVAPITPNMADVMIDFYKEMKMKDFLFIFGVGDHGGGPTRKHLNWALELMTWKIFPTVKLSTNEDFFKAAETYGDLIPTHNDEINFIFRGCYASQSKVKKVNRFAENAIPETEAITALMGDIANVPYPRAELHKAWTNTMYNQFHDILAGSSEHAAMEDADCRYRETEAICGTVKMRVLNNIAKQINTKDTFGDIKWDDKGVAGGFGDVRLLGRVSNFSGSSSGADIFVVYNPTSEVRSEVVYTKVWNKAVPANKIAVRDDRGNITPAQLTGHSMFVEHTGINIAFLAKDIPAFGYRTFAVYESDKPIIGNNPFYHPCLFEFVAADNSGIENKFGINMASLFSMENDYLSVEVDPGSGAIKHLIDKETGFDYVPEGGLIGVLEEALEVPHIMTSWQHAQEVKSEKILKGGRLVDDNDPSNSFDADVLSMVVSNRVPMLGPVRGSIRTLHSIGNSKVILEVALDVDSKAVEINIEARWREMGSSEIGVPILKLGLPINASDCQATYEIPYGTIKRPSDNKDVPGLRWSDFTGENNSEPVGFTLLNDSKNGFSANGNEMKVVLIRTSYDPDPLPEMGKHNIRFKLVPHKGALCINKAMSEAEIFNKPMGLTSTGLQNGSMPTNISFVQLTAGTVQISAIKKAEDSDDIVVRLYETEGQDTVAKLRFPYHIKGNTKIYFCDLMERVIDEIPLNTDGDEILVPILKYGLVSIVIKNM